METAKKGQIFDGSNAFATSVDELFMNLQKPLFLYLVAIETAKKGKIFGGSNANFLRIGSNNNCTLSKCICS